MWVSWGKKERDLKLFLELHEHWCYLLFDQRDLCYLVET